MTEPYQRSAGVPLYAPISQACDLLGFRRSKLYELAGEGSIRVIKVGGRSLVDMDAARAWMATRPAADIAAAHKPNT